MKLFGGMERNELFISVGITFIFCGAISYFCYTRIKNIENAVTKLVAKLLPNANPKYAVASGKGVRAGAEMGAINTVAHGIGKSGGSGGSVEMEKSVIDANKKIKPNYSGVQW